jgi:poly(hydroxyalkanoate) depolymerase family esterase
MFSAMLNLFLSLSLLVLMPAQVWAKKIQFIFMARNFTIVVPDNKLTGPRPLVVLLHGCRQNPDMFLDGTRIEKEATKNNFLILAPQQPSYYNTHECWNWFFDFQQQRNITTEMGQIVASIPYISQLYKIDYNKIFVTGISAGGALAHNLTVCYPDVFAGSAIHSGFAFKTAETIDEANAVTSAKQKSPEYLGKKMYACAHTVSKHKLNKVLIIQGKTDKLVPYRHAALISDSQAVWRDYLDDGQRNNSARGAISSQKIKFTNNYEIERTDIRYADFSERKLLINGMGHAWGGGKPVSEYFDPKAPSSTQFILDFFGLIK